LSRNDEKDRNDKKDNTQTFMGLRTRLQERVAMPYGTGKWSKNLVRGRNRPKSRYQWMAGFQFYDLVWWLDRPTKPNFKDHTRRLARWLGVSHRFGPDMSYAHYWER
jgi:hypothetical protein